MKKSALIATLVTATLFATPAFAGDRGHGCEGGHRGPGHHAGFLGKVSPEELLSREFNAAEIRTLMEARLLMRGNENLKVGAISPKKSGYTVAIVTQDDSIVKELDLAANGMPKKHFERMKKRLEKREKRANS